MSSESWNKLERHFAASQPLTPAERDAYVEAVRAEDPALAAQLDALLEADASETFIVGAISDEVSTLLDDVVDPHLGARFGAYIVTGVLGRGGMGNVYLGERADEEFEQRVAIKLLGQALVGPQAVGRFLRERQILANLSHPNISQLLDGGATEEGLPYLVMELVEGQPIDTYCDDNRLSIDARLGLFRQVCDAVDHAHRNLIVHRDIKPTNILVTREGVPKLLDFGIAKLLDDSTAESGPALTRQAMRIMTPEYASPEQVRGEPITVTTDVYALGVLLYELLSGRHPTPLGGLNGLELERAICETEPTKPSASTRHERDGEEIPLTPDALAAQRSATPQQLRTTLAGDLDNIVLKAMRKEPGRRYASAQKFADDIERYLASLPVLAHPASWRYRAGKFVRRNRLAVFGSAAMALILAAVISFYTMRVTSERDRAQLEAAKAEQVSRFLLELFETADPSASLGEAVTARSLLDQGRFRVRDLDSQPAVQAAMKDVMGAAYRGLGLYDQSRPLLDDAYTTRRRLYGPSDPETLRSLNARGMLQIDMGEYEEALALYEAGLATARREFGEQHTTTAVMLRQVGVSMQQLARYEEAESYYRQALAVQSALVPGPDELKAGILEDLGRLLDDAGRSDEAIPMLREAIAMFQTVKGENHPAYLIAADNLGWALLSVGDFDGAESVFRDVLAERRRMFGEAHPETYGATAALGTVAFDRGDFAAAEPLYRESLEGFRNVLGEGHPEVAIGANNLATTLESLARHDEAGRYYRMALRMNQSARGPLHPETATSLSNFGVFLMRNGQYDEAGEHILGALDARRETLGEQHPHTAASLGIYALYLQETGDLEASRTWHERTLDVRTEVHGVDHPLYGATLSRYGDVLRELGELHAAEEALLDADPVLRAAYPDGHARVAGTTLALAQLREAQGEAAAAAAAYRQSLEEFAALYEADHPAIGRALLPYGEFLISLGEPDEAEAVLDRSLTILQARAPDGDWRIPAAQSALGESLMLAQDCAAAEPLLAEGHGSLLARRGPDDAMTRRAAERMAQPCVDGG